MLPNRSSHNCLDKNNVIQVHTIIIMNFLISIKTSLVYTAGFHRGSLVGKFQCKPFNWVKLGIYILGNIYEKNVWHVFFCDEFIDHSRISKYCAVPNTFKNT